jgi:N6-adenosine-specific RNA methylase IME4/ParB-like chromosome segregation protein Spo0J
MQYEFHPLANVFPLIEDAEFDKLVADIKQNGVHERVVLHEDMILDGRNRYRACLAAGVEPLFVPYGGEDPVAFVISINLRRRHLDESQRAMVAARLATLKQGARTDISPIGEMSQADAAGLLKVGKRTVERAREVLNQGAPALVHAVEQGRVSVSAAADVATLADKEQQEIVARGEREILEAAKAIRSKRAEQRHATRMKELATIGSMNPSLPGGRKYPVICADPPWQFHLWNADATDTTAESNYPVMPTNEIAAMPVGELSTDQAVLFLWATSPMLPEALEVMRAWGFEYVTNIAWKKNRAGLGYWVRTQHELLLIGRRGGMPSPLPANRPNSVIEADRREHSRKPDEAYQLIERMYPELPKIELFARSAREGWARWGNQAPPADNDDGLDIPDYLRRDARPSAKA